MLKKVIMGVSLLCWLTSIAANTNVIKKTWDGTKHIAKKTFHGTERMLTQHVNRPFYFGVSGGYGNTDWSKITTTPGSLAAPSAPIGATSGGFAYGLFAGYQFSKHFMIEGNYTRYPQTTVNFDPGNLYALDSLVTNTDTYSLLGKILVPFGFTKVYVYADAGVTIVHRSDSKLHASAGLTPSVGKVNKYKAGPSFGFGLAMNVTPRIFSEVGFQYTTGYDKADAKPAVDYIPFVYSIMFNLGIRV